jgi:hypothetical protein
VLIFLKKFVISYAVDCRQSTTMSTLSNDDGDFIMLLLLLSCQLPLLALIFSEAKLIHFLSLAELRRRDRRIRRCALVDANQSPWQKLYHSRNDQSYITFTGVDCGTFEYLLSKFRLMYQRYSPYSINGKIVRVVIQDGMPGRPR